MAAIVATMTMVFAANAQETYSIYMVLWRGETDIERGFRSYANERNLSFEYKVVSVNRDKSKLAGVRSDIRTTNPDLVYTWGTSVTTEIFGTTENAYKSKYISDIKGVFTLVSAPIQSGIVPDYKSSQRNITGVRFIAPLNAQVLAIQNYRPVKSIAVIFNTEEQNSVANVRELEKYLPTQGIKLLKLPVPLKWDAEKERNTADESRIRKLVQDAKSQGAELIYLGPDSFIAANADQLTNETNRLKIPTFAATEFPLENSNALYGLVSPYYLLGRLTAQQAEKMLIENIPPDQIPIRKLYRHVIKINQNVMNHIKYYPTLELIRTAEFIKK